MNKIKKTWIRKISVMLTIIMIGNQGIVPVMANEEILSDQLIKEDEKSITVENSIVEVDDSIATTDKVLPIDESYSDRTLRERKTLEIQDVSSHEINGDIFNPEKTEGEETVSGNLLNTSIPEMECLTINNKSVLVPGQIAITAEVVPNLESITVSFKCDDNERIITCNLKNGGLNNNGNYYMEGFRKLNEYTYPGTYRVDKIQLRLRKGMTIYRWDIQDEDITEKNKKLPDCVHDLSIEVINNGQYDINPPELKSISLSTKNYVISENENVEVILKATDDVSGLEYATIELIDENSKYRDNPNEYSVEFFKKGINENGEYEFVGYIYNDITPGKYQIFMIDLTDVGGNHVCYDENQIIPEWVQEIELCVYDKLSIKETTLSIEGNSYITDGYETEVYARLDLTGTFYNEDVLWEVSEGNAELSTSKTSYNKENKEKVRVKYIGKPIDAGCTANIKLRAYIPKGKNGIDPAVATFEITVYSKNSISFNASDRTLTYKAPAKVNTGVTNGQDSDNKDNTKTIISYVKGVKLQVLSGDSSLGTTSTAKEKGTSATIDAATLESIVNNLSSKFSGDSVSLTFRAFPCDSSAVYNKNVFADAIVNVYRVEFLYTRADGTLRREMVYGFEGQEIDITKISSLKSGVIIDDDNHKVTKVKVSRSIAENHHAVSFGKYKNLLFSIAPSNIFLNKGEKALLTLNADPAVTDNEIIWASSDETIVSINGNGKTATVTAQNKEGSAKIMATYGGLREYAEVTVGKESPIIFDKHSLSLEVNRVKFLTVTTISEKISSEFIIWKSDDPTVASVDDTGIIKGISPGKTTIRAITSYGSELGDSCEVTVIPSSAPEILTLTPQTISTGVPSKVNYTITTSLDISSAELEFSSEYDSYVLTCVLKNVGKDADGNYSLQGTLSLTNDNFSGRYRIVKIKLNNNNDTVQYIWDINEKEITEKNRKLPEWIYLAYLDVVNSNPIMIPVTNVNITTRYKELKVGKTLNIIAHVKPETSSIKSISWSSSDVNIATVSDEGTVTGVGVGKAVITATSHNGKKAICIVDVWNNQTPDPDGTKGTINNVTVEKDNTTVNYSISKQGVLNILVDGVVIKSYDIEAGENKSKELPGIRSLIHENKNLINGMYLYDFDIELTEDNALTPKLLDGLYNIELDEPLYRLEVKSSDTSKGAVHIDNEGTTLLYGCPNEAFNYKLYAKAMPGYEFDYWEYKGYSRNDNPFVLFQAFDGIYVAYFKPMEGTVTPILVSNVTLSQNTIYLKPGTNKVLDATVEPYNASNKELKWSSSNESIATVDNSGLIRALSEGTVIITVSSTDGSEKSASCTVNVVNNLVEAESVIVDPSSKAIKTGDNFTVSASIIPENTTDKSIIWTSDKPTVATVSAEGVVTAISEGVAHITATTNNGKTASCTVTVTEKTVKVSFDVCTNEISAPGAVTVSSNKPYGDLPTPIRKGHKFLGWFTAATGGNLVDKSTIVKNTADHTLYAHWQAESSTEEEKKKNDDMNSTKEGSAITAKKLDVSKAFGEKPTGTTRYVIKNTADKKLASVGKKNGLITPKKSGKITVTLQIKDGKNWTDVKSIEYEVVVPKGSTLPYGKAYYEGQKIDLNTLLKGNEDLHPNSWETKVKSTVATVDSSTGMLTVGSKNGTATVYAIYGTGKYARKVKVAVKINHKKVDVSGAFSPVSGKVRYKILDKADRKLASVSSKGILMAKKNGSVTVTMQVKSGTTWIDKESKTFQVTNPFSGVIY